jgi:hypothetical protein
MVTRISAAFLSLAALASCSGRAPPSAGEPGKAISSLAEVAGPWDIARFAGYTPMRLHEGVRRAYVDISPNGLSYVIECNYSGNPAHVDPAGILHDDGDGTRISTAMGCGPVGEAREAAFFAFFSSRPNLAWGPGGRLRLSNGRTELLLERPEVRRLANVPARAEIAGRWVPQMATRLLDPGGYQGWGFQNPTILAIDGDRVSYSGCGRPAFGFRYTAEGRMVTEGQADSSACETESPALFLLQVLSNDPLVERIAGGGIALTAGRQVITLRREETLRRLRDSPPGPAPKAPPPPPRRPPTRKSG